MMQYKVSQESASGFPDTATFIDFLSSLNQGNFLKGGEEIFVTRAPGRLDVMGGVADYSGSLVLQLPIAAATHAALQKNDSTKIRVLSAGSGSKQRFIELDTSDFLTDRHKPVEYSSARAQFNNENDHWAAYAAGVILTLMREKEVQFSQGIDILIRSDVPEGKGVSSSAAIEVAVMQALNVAFDLKVSAAELAALCQKTENLIAGAPCGIMDQMTSSCGEKDQLLELLCQPAILKGCLALPSELELWGIDSGIRHSVGGSDYGTVRTAAFMGYRIIADLAGLKVSTTEQEGKVRVDDDRWGGYLANISPEEFESRFSSSLPVQIRGDDFLERYVGITDYVTDVKADVDYPVRVATRHPIYEHARVKEFASLLRSWSGNEGPRLGQLMFQSHQSYSDCGLGSPATDLIAKIVEELGAVDLYGARITGGGSGGTVAVLGRHASPGIHLVHQRFMEETGYAPLIISGSSAGASVFDHVKIT